MAVYKASPEVMQRSLTMTHTFINLGLGFVPIPVLSPEHYAELMELYVTNMQLLEEKADAKKPNELELCEDIEEAEIVAPQPAPMPLSEAPLPIPTKRKRKPLKQQSTEKDNTDGSL